MAEALRPKPRKTKVKKSKPSSVTPVLKSEIEDEEKREELVIPPEPELEQLNEQTEATPAECSVISGTEEDKSELVRATPLDKNEEKEEEIPRVESEFEAKTAEVNDIKETEESSGEYLSMEQEEDDKVEAETPKHDKVIEGSSQCLDIHDESKANSTGEVTSLADIATSDKHDSLPQRPQNLPNFKSLAETLKSVSLEADESVASSEASVKSHVSLASHMQMHHSLSSQKLSQETVESQDLPGHLYSPAGAFAHMPRGPAVVEDPDTPMSRTVSPTAAKGLREEPRASPSTFPTLVQEEKSPTLLAEEALARVQISNLSTQQESTEPQTNRLPSPQQETCDSVIGGQVQARVQSENQNTKAEELASAPLLSFLSTQGEEEITTAPPEPSIRQDTKPKVQCIEQSKQAYVSKNKIGALSLSELLALYYNPQLACNDAFVDEFVQKEVKRDNHEFVEILSNYFRARNQLVCAEEDIRLLQKSYAELQKDLWIFRPKTVSAQGQCGDQAKVSMTYNFSQAELNKDSLSQIAVTLGNIRSEIAENLSLFSYSAQISRLQVESYIHDLYMNCPALRDIPKNACVQACFQVLPDQGHQLQKLKDCITILFMFHRRPTRDSEFIESIRQWTIRLVSSLLRLATFSDHLYVLNHILRCPAGVSKWGVELVQSPPLEASVGQHQGNFGSPLLDHVITAMATILLPAKARAEFMCHMRINVSQESIQEEKAWILVDSDGEEDEDPANSWLYLHENDIVALLGQFSLVDIFSHILLASTSDTGVVDYDVRRSTEPMMMKLFAFATVFIRLLGAGLKTYSMARYRQLNKRLGRLIRQTTSFVSDHWLNFKAYYGPLAPAASIEALQAEYDQLFMRATYSILSAQKLGSWQFMADMPYTPVSHSSMWQLLWVLHQGQGQVVNLDQMPSVEECISYLENSDSWQQLADNLMHMPTSEAIYLLTTFANMASCRSFEEQAFIRTITLEVFEIAYICNHTREFCSKVGRELLSGIIQTHPSALSFLLARVKEVMDKLGKMSLYLFSELPVGIWQPTDPDMLLLRQWLLNFDLSFFENQLARVVLSKINWDIFEESGRLVVDIRLHRQVALLLVEAYTRFISDKKAGFFILEGMKQMASYISSGPSAEQAFNNWAWDLALRLKLHQQSILLHSYSAADTGFQPPNLGADAWLLPVLKGTSSRTPVACFVALTMTSIGHDITSFIAEGLDLLTVLTSNYQYTTAIHVLGCVTPLFMDCQHYLLENVVFCQILQSLLAADESLIKSTKSAIMSVEFPGIVTHQLTEMIQAQITSHLSQGKADQVIAFWMHAIFKVCKYFTDRNSCHVANTLIQWCFVKKGVTDIISDIFKENYVKFCLEFKNRQGLVASMFSWIASQTTLPSYMDSPSLPEFPWLAYMILYIEGEAEVSTQLWQVLQMELHSPIRPNVDSALKTAVTRLHLEQAPLSSRLVIYRWAQQALDTPHDHPLLPILWQRFFALYLGRQVFESSLAQRASVGERFFESLTSSHMLKKMRKRLTETSTLHMNFDPQQNTKSRRRGPHSPGTPPGEAGQDQEAFGSGGTGQSGAVEDTSLEYTSSREFHQMLARLYQTFSLWLEEPRLHDGNLYLPALPPQYEAARLNQVFQGFMGPWLEFVDLEGVQYNLSCLAADWRKRLTCIASACQSAARRRSTLNEPENATERIIRRLRRYDPPKCPPQVGNVQSAVPVISSAIMDDRDALMHLVSADLEILTHYTKIFSARLAHHCVLDNIYLELIPGLFSNVAKTVTLTAECRSKVNPLHRCKNPAVMPVKVNMKELNEIVQRKIDENRVEYKQVMIESLLPTAPNICVSAVHTENAITLLIKQFQSTTDNSRQQRLNDVACRLFFHLADIVCTDTDIYPPTKQFFASCIEILGLEFVSKDASQTERVLRLCLDKPSVSGLVSPHFIPNSCPGHLITMYGQLIHVLQAQNMELVFMLLTKFDIRQWLENHLPGELDRKMFVESLGSALMACGAEPNAESKMVFGLYLRHLASVLESNFPLNLYIVLNMVFQGSAAERLHTQVWETVLTSCFTDRNQGDSRARSASVFNMKEIASCSETRLLTGQVKELLDWMASFFFHVRMTNTEVLAFGLYSKWARYVPYVSLMVGTLYRSFVSKVIIGTEEMSPYQITELLWQTLVALFLPWVQPLVSEAQEAEPYAPWVEGDDVVAIEMVSTFRKCIVTVYQQMLNKHPTEASGILSLVLMYYMTALSTKSSPAYFTNILRHELQQLPWQHLRPDLQLLESMTKVKEISSPSCFSLIGQILPRIPWREIMSYFGPQQAPQIGSRMQAGLGVLLIQTYVDPELMEAEDLRQLLLEAERFDWSLMTQEGFTCVCNWFLQLCDPKCVLAERSSVLALGIRLLKQMSGFQADIPWSETVSQKRLTFVHCITQQLCQITYLKDTAREPVRTVIINLLSDIEAVESSVTLAAHQEEESARLLKDVLSLLNNSNPDGQWLDDVMSSLTGWLHSSPQSLLLVPCMKACSHSLASLRQMAVVMETCIEVYFMGVEHPNAVLKGWPFILSVFQVPELNQAAYVTEAMSENAFLVLHAYLQHRMTRCQSLQDELVLMENILDWTCRSQPSAEDEAKLVLWWHQLLRLMLRQVEYSAPLSGPINILSRFTNHLNQLGQERASKGLLGAIGLGRKSPLSPKMRVTARALSAFITTQILSAQALRVQSDARPPGPSTLGELRTLRKQKEYTHLVQVIDHAVIFIQDSSKTFKDCTLFLARVVKALYTHQYLSEVVKMA